MAKRGRKTAKAKDDKGYLDSNKDAFTDYKVIKGNKITMEGVSGKIYAIPIDNKGNAGAGRLMKSGENHTFENAANIIEVPEVAMAQLGVNTGDTIGTTNPYLQEAIQASLTGQGVTPPYVDPLTQEGINTDFGSPNYGTTTPTPVPVNTPAQRPKDEVADWNKIFNVTPNADGKTSGIKFGASAEDQLKESAKVATTELEQQYAQEEEDNTIEPTQKIQFDNPYGGVDIPTAAQTLGASLSYDGDMKGANTARGVASGLKLLTGLGRNVMSGYGQNKRNQYAVDEFNKDQKNQIKGQVQFKQEGGSVSSSEGALTEPLPTRKKRTEKEVTAAQLLAGNVMTGDPTVEANIEVEDGEHVKDNQTGQVQEVVGNKHSQGGEKMNLEDHKVLSDYTKVGGDLAKKYRDEFDVKVKAKDTYATVMDKILKKTGYKSITEELTSTIEMTQKEQEKAKERDSEATTGINMQHLSGKINDLSKDLEPLEEMKSNVFETLFSDQQGSKTKAELDKEGSVPEAQEGVDTGDTSFNKDQSRKRFIDFANTAKRLGYEGEIDVNAENLDAEAAKLQAYMVKNHPQIAAQYAKQNRITAKGLDKLKTTSPEIFQQAGLDVNKEAAEYSDEELAQLSSIAQDAGVVDDAFWLDQFNDGLWRYRAPNVAQDQSVERHNLIPSPKLDITAQLMSDPNAGVVQGDEKDSVKGVSQDEASKRSGNGTGNSTLLLPDQTILPPGSMQPHRLGEVTPREAEAKLISPTAQIEEINRQAMTAKAEINSLPDTQRRAALAQLNAQTQQSINQVMSQTNRANAQIEGQNEERNIQRAGQADILNEQFADSHERNTLLAKDKTEQDIRNYFNAQNKKQVANYNTVQNLNLTNAMYDNFQYTGDGRVVQTGKAPTAEELVNNMSWYQSLSPEEQEKIKKERSKETKAKKAKRGRKI